MSEILQWIAIALIIVVVIALNIRLSRRNKGCHHCNDNCNCPLKEAKRRRNQS